MIHDTSHMILYDKIRYDIYDMLRYDMIFINWSWLSTGG